MYSGRIVNHHTYLRGLTSKGTIACMKRFFEIISRGKAEIMISMDRLTNLNPKVGSEVLHSNQNVRGVKHYVVCIILSQSKQPTRITRENGESPKGIRYQKQSEFGISRNTKVWGRRRIHSTTIINGKGSSEFSIGDIEFKGSIIKDQFNKLQNDLKLGNKANNLTTILSNEEFLIGCYHNIRSKQSSMIKNLDEIKLEWFKEVCTSFKNGMFRFKPLKRIYIPKLNGKKKALTIPSPGDKIVQEGMRILLSCIFEGNFKESSHAFRSVKGCHTSLNQVRIQCKKVKWFIKGKIEQQDLNINHTILVEIMRTKIQDEPFIDLIFKYVKVGYSEENRKEIVPIKRKLAQGGLIYPVLFNIYMHFFDAWVEDEFVYKHIKKKINFYYAKMIKKYEKTVDKTIVSTDENFGRVYYIRHVDDFLIGVQGSKKTCDSIRSRIKTFLKEKLGITLNIDKTKITHSTIDQTLFLKYHINCVPIEKMRINSNVKKRLARNTNRMVLNAPIKRVMEELKEKGFLNSRYMPTRNSRYTNIDLWNIIENYRTIEKEVLNYYAMANNYNRLAAKVHYSLKYSCALTICSKMKLKTMKRVFNKYGKNLTITINKKSISYPNISYK